MSSISSTSETAAGHLDAEMKVQIFPLHKKQCTGFKCVWKIEEKLLERRVKITKKLNFTLETDSFWFVSILPVKCSCEENCTANKVTVSITYHDKDSFYKHVHALFILNVNNKKTDTDFGSVLLFDNSLQKHIRDDSEQFISQRIPDPDHKLFQNGTVEVTISGATWPSNFVHLTGEINSDLKMNLNRLQITDDALESEEKDFILVSTDGKIHIPVSLERLKSKSNFFAIRYSVGARMFQVHHKKNMNQHKFELDVSAFKELVQFLCTNTVSENFSEHALELLSVAHECGIQDLKEICERRIVRTISIVNAVRLFVTARINESKLLKKKTAEFIEKNGECISKTESWKILELDHENVVMLTRTIISELD